jgi:hypothetical protein
MDRDYQRTKNNRFGHQDSLVKAGTMAVTGQAQFMFIPLKKCFAIK